ncbi:hypothetical protein AWH62_15200 [Maricaulis sp. W15]|uniref:hypothetical protein n=1 Tax=Maricaulis sp. W15 TaxID=1772333 RepID=UPI000948EE97|nr:hypothetical protein [Maricaulis sp. W15]OLF80578.1 hypothetical protein AWH62_15200 [Maricaulis sp. W15]
MVYAKPVALLAATFSIGMGAASADCPADPVLVRMAHVEDNRFAVAVSAPGSQGPIDISWREAEGTRDGQADFLSDVVFERSDGALVAAEYAGYGTWQLPGAGDSDGDALWDGYRYTLTADHDRAVWNIGKEEIAYRFDDGFYFVLQSVLAVSYGWGDCQFDVRMDLPDGWQAVTPWAEAGEHAFAVSGLNSLIRNLIVLGPNLEPQTLALDGLDVVIISEGVFDEARPAFAEVLRRSLAAYTEIFGGVPMERYLVAFGEDDMNDGGAFAESFGQRLPAPFREHERLMWARSLAHESLHAWIGIAISRNPDAELQWFTEGGTDYLTMKTLYRTELVDANDVIFMIEGQIRRFLLGRIQSGPVSLAEAGENKQENRTLVYGGGALFHLLLDARMTELHGGGSYEAALRSLYEADDRRYSQARMLAALDARSDGAASEILAMLNGPFDPFGLLAEVDTTGLATAAFGPDEILVRFAAQGCAGSRDAACMPDFLSR